MRTQSALTISYDLHVKRRGRWTIDAAYATGERSLAFEAARRRAAYSGVQGTRVVRECYNALVGTSSEAVIFDSGAVVSDAEHVPAAAASTVPSARTRWFGRAS
jgi:hypothetical protein